MKMYSRKFTYLGFEYRMIIERGSHVILTNLRNGDGKIIQIPQYIACNKKEFTLEAKIKNTNKNLEVFLDEWVKNDNKKQEKIKILKDFGFTEFDPEHPNF